MKVSRGAAKKNFVKTEKDYVSAVTYISQSIENDAIFRNFFRSTWPPSLRKASSSQSKPLFCFVDFAHMLHAIVPRNQVHGAPPSSPLKVLRMVPVGVMITGSLKMDCGLMF